MSRPSNQGTTREEPTASANAGPLLLLPADLFSDKIVRELIDDWIVPNLVDEFLQSQGPSSDHEDLEHNGNL